MINHVVKIKGKSEGMRAGDRNPGNCSRGVEYIQKKNKKFRKASS